MTLPTFGPIPSHGMFTAWVANERVEVLCRSADWYHLPAIQRYLYNMAASEIRMEDAKTETRVYTFARYEHLRTLILRSLGQECEVAWEAYQLWFVNDMEFGVVHLEQGGGRRGDLLIGDGPGDFLEFAARDDGEERWTHVVRPAHGIEGSDV